MATHEEHAEHANTAGSRTSEESESRKQLVEAHFSSVSERYHDKNYVQPWVKGKYPDILMRHRRILEMVLGLHGRALDIGCGSGRLLLDLQRLGFDVSGVDFSQAMVDATRSLFLRYGTFQLPDLKTGDIEKLDFADQTFDLVVAAGVIEYLGSDDRALAEIRRILRPGGAAILSVRNRRNFSRPLLLLRDALQALPGIGPVIRASHRLFRRMVPAAPSPYWPAVRYHVLGDFRETLEQNGLQVEEVASYHFDVCPPLLRRMAPQLSIRIGLALEKLCRSPLRVFAGAHVVKVRRVELPEKRASLRPGARSRLFPPAVVVRLGVTGLGVARSLSHPRVPGRIPIIAVDAGFSQSAARTRLCARFRCDDLDSPPVIDRLIELGQRFTEKPVLFLTDDATVLRVSAEEERLRPFYRFTLPPQGTVRLLADKTAFAEYAAKNGFRIPMTWVIYDEADLALASTNLSFPCILKPSWRPAAWESRKIPKAFIVETADELRELYRKHSSVHSTFVLQEWIPGPDSEIYYCLTYFDARSRCLGTFTGRKLRQWPCGAGNTSFTEPYACPEIERETVRLFEGLRFRGLGSVEFKRDPRDGTYKIIEPTVGRPNLQSEIATANGVNLAWEAYADLTEIDPGPRIIPSRPVRWVHEATDFRSGLQQVMKRSLSLREWLRSYRGPRLGALFVWRDPLPFIDSLRKNGTGIARRLLRDAVMGSGTQERAAV